jgi:hypothetical protein
MKKTKTRDDVQGLNTIDWSCGGGDCMEACGTECSLSCELDGCEAYCGTTCQSSCWVICDGGCGDNCEHDCAITCETTAEIG